MFDVYNMDTSKFIGGKTMIELKGGFEMTNEKAYMELGNIYTRMLGTGTLCLLEYRAKMNTLQEMASNDMTLKAHHRVNITSELNRLQSLAFCKYSVEE